MKCNGMLVRRRYFRSFQIQISKLQKKTEIKKKFSRRGKKRDKLTSFSFLDAILTFYFASLFVTKEKSDEDVESWRRAARCRKLWHRNVAPGKVECRLSLAPEERDAADTKCGAGKGGMPVTVSGAADIGMWRRGI